MKAFRRPYLLTRHVKICHPHSEEEEEEEGFDCEWCGRSFKQKSDFTQHWRLCSEFSEVRAQFKKTLQRAQLQSAVDQIQKSKSEFNQTAPLYQDCIWWNLTGWRTRSSSAWHSKWWVRLCGLKFASRASHKTDLSMSNCFHFLLNSDPSLYERIQYLLV